MRVGNQTTLQEPAEGIDQFGGNSSIAADIK